MSRIHDAVPNKFSQIVNLVSAAFEGIFGYSSVMVLGGSLLKKN
jgi:hypothetical protein